MVTRRRQNVDWNKEEEKVFLVGIIKKDEKNKKIAS